ncbi:MAG TPA: RNA polymerase sigma factor [Polyangia bacterium]|nr:RNA polymerase sigma factor [Polyangia bacterium]
MTTNGALQVVVTAGPSSAVRGGGETGDESFAALLLGQRRSLLAYASMLSGDRSMADDLVQDTFERALRAGARFQAGSNLSAWLRRILKNLFTDRCRERRRYVDIDNDEVAGLATPPAPDDAAGGVTAVLLGRVTLDDVHSALADLAPALREVFVLAHLERRNYQNIAATLRIPISTVGTRLWRARARLRDVLSARCAPPPPAARGRVPRWPAANTVTIS